MKKIKTVMMTVALMGAMPMMGQNNLLHYDKPAEYFEEALPIGNGTMGAMIYGDVDEENISLNDITLWTGEPDKKVFSPGAYKNLAGIREALFNEDYKKANELNKAVEGHYSQNYQPLGTLTLSPSLPSGHLPKMGDKLPKNNSNYSRTLDISKAVANVSYGNYSNEYFASAPDSVIVIRLRAKDGEKINERLSYNCQLMSMVGAKVSKDKVAQMTIDGYAAWGSKPNYAGGGSSFQYDSDKGIHFRTIIRVVNKDGEVSVVSQNELQLTDCTEAMIIIANVTSFNGNDKDPVKEGRDYKTLVWNRVENAAKKAYEELLDNHEKDYTLLYNRVNIDLGTTPESVRALPTNEQLLRYTQEWEKIKTDGKTIGDGGRAAFNPDLEELYFNYGRYLLISCSRTEGVPANLQGLWNESILPPWSCNYTSNINVEENYWPSEVANLGELQEKAMVGFVKKLPVTGRETAKEYYGVGEGWCLAHNTDIWGMTNPVGEHEGDPSWACWNMGGAWISTHLWEHFAFTEDKEYLKDVYPTLKGAADFVMNWLIKLPKSIADKEGLSENTLITAPSTSPENIYKTPEGYEGATMYGGFADIAMAKECLMDTRNAAIMLGESKDYIEKLTQTINNLLPYRIGKKGNLQEWFHDWEDKDPQHRHQSHLFGLYPGHHISVAETPELAKACKKTLEIKGDKTTGWSTGWRVNLQARLHEPEAAYNIYRMLLNYISPDGYKGKDKRKGGGTYPNLFDAHSPFQIDGNFGGCAGVMEMLVQSGLRIKDEGGKSVSTSEIEVLPALPEAWKAEGSVKGLKARGGYEVSLSWKSGKLTALSLKDVRPQGSAKQTVTVKWGSKTWKKSSKSGQKIDLI